MATYINPTNTTQLPNQKIKGAEQFAIDNPTQPFPLEQQKQENVDFNQQFTSFLSGMETPQETRDKYENRYGYQDLREGYTRGAEQMADMQARIQATPDQVRERAQSAGTIVTQGQIDKIANKEVAGLMDAYNKLGQITESQGSRLAMAEQNMNDAAKLEMAQQQKMLTPWLQAYDDKNVMQAREYSGWTFASQLELNTLLANQSAGLQWTDAEANRANALAMQEKAFKNSIEYLEKQNEMAIDLW